MNAYGSTCVVLSSDLWLSFVVPLNLTFLVLTLSNCLESCSRNDFYRLERSNHVEKSQLSFK